MQSYYWVLAGIPLVFLGAGGLAALWIRLYQYKNEYIITEKQRHETPEMDIASPNGTRIFVDWGNGLGGKYYWEPSPGAFRAWIRDAAAGKSTLGFNNEGKPRGWSKPAYLEMIAQLNQQGIVFDSNGSKHTPPQFTTRGAKLVAEWAGIAQKGK
jgi:hypothetical protein